MRTPIGLVIVIAGSLATPTFAQDGEEPLIVEVERDLDVEVRSFLDGVFDAIERDDWSAVLWSFDPVGGLERLAEYGLFDGLEAEEARIARLGWRATLRRSGPRFVAEWMKGRAEVRLVRASPLGKRAVASVRMWEDDVPVWTRCFLRHTSGGWRIEELEQVESGWRLSALAIQRTRGRSERHRGLIRVLGDIEALALAIDGGDLVEVAEWLSTPPPGGPEPLRTIRRLVRANGFAALGLPSRVLAELEVDVPASERTPHEWYLIAAARNALGDHTAARRQLMRYAVHVGDDVSASNEAATAALGLAEREAAIGHLWSALRDDPAHLPTLGRLAAVVEPADPAQVGDLVERVRGLDDLFLGFPGIVESALAHGGHAGALIVCDEVDRIAPGLPLSAYYRARALYDLERDAAAAAVIDPAVRAASERGGENIDDYLRLQLAVLRRWKGARVALRACADPLFAYRTLAASCAADGDAAGLAELNDAYAQANANDPVCLYWQGRERTLRGDHAGAALLLDRVAHTVSAEPALRADARIWALRAAVRSGGAARVLAQAADRSAAFGELAPRVLELRDPRAMLDLLQIAERGGVSATDVLVWRAASELAGDRPEAALRLLGEPFADGVDPTAAEMDLFVRALSRTGDHATATELAGLLEAEADVLLLRAIAHGGEGDVVRTAACLRMLIDEHGVEPATIYDDPDLGPVLRGDAFSDLRLTIRPADED